MTGPEHYTTASTGTETPWSIVDQVNSDGTRSWASVGQDPNGDWWVTVTGNDDDTTTGPFLDEVQALRALRTWEAP